MSKKAVKDATSFGIAEHAPVSKYGLTHPKLYAYLRSLAVASVPPVVGYLADVDALPSSTSIGN